jgi:hypothetical protein
MTRVKNLAYKTGWAPVPSKRDATVEVYGTLIERVADELGVYSFDAYTLKGLWLRGVLFEFDEPVRDELLRRLKDFEPSWAAREPVLIGFAEQETPSARRISVLDPEREVGQEIDALREEWAPSADDLLERLESNATPPADRLTAVLFAETTAFSLSQRPRLVRALFRFISPNRFVEENEVVTAVGAAIRKLAMNMEPSDFEEYAQLFVLTPTDPLPCEIELELVKAISWRLETLQPPNSGAYPTLETQLSDVAAAYLAPRLILQKNHASIAINAILGVALLNGARQDGLVNQTRHLGLDWLSDLVGRRLSDAARKRASSGFAGSENLMALQRSLVHQ